MVSRTLSYVARLRGEVDPSLERSFGAVDDEVAGLERQIRQTAERQQELTRAIRDVDAGRGSYEDLQREIRQTERRADDLTHTIQAQRQQLSTLEEGSREYDALQGRIRQAERRAEGLTDTLEEQQRRLDDIDRGSAAYDQMQRELRRTERESERLNRSLADQREALERNARTARRFRTVALAAFGALSAGAVGVTAELRTSGQEYARLLQVVESTGFEIGEIERLQRQARVQGYELEAVDFREFANRIGETQAEVNRVIAEGGDPFTQGIGAAGEALRDLGFDVRAVTNDDLPAIIDALRGVDRELREFYGQEIFGGGEFEALGAALDVPPDVLARLSQIPTTSRETAEAARLANAEMEAMLATTRQISRDAAVAFVPAFEAAAAVLVPIAGTMADIARSNPALIQALAATVAGVAGLSAAVWLLNSALAVRAALSGPVGWAALGVAAAVGGGIAIGGAVAARNAGSGAEPGDAIAADEAREREATSAAIEDASYRGTRAGAEETAQQQEETLRNILPERCPEEMIADAIRDGFAGLREPTPHERETMERAQFAPSADLGGLTPQESARLSVAAGQLGAPDRMAQEQAARALTAVQQANAATREAALTDPAAGAAGPVDNPYDAAHRVRVLAVREALRDPGERVSMVDRPGELPVASAVPVTPPPPELAAEAPAAPSRTERAAADPLLGGASLIVDSVNRLGGLLSFGLIGTTDPLLPVPAPIPMGDQGDTISQDLRRYETGDTISQDLRRYETGDTISQDLRRYETGDTISQDLRRYETGDTISQDLRRYETGDTISQDLRRYETGDTISQDLRRYETGDTISHSAPHSYTDARTTVTIERVEVGSGQDADDIASELQAALETTRLGGG